MSQKPHQINMLSAIALGVCTMVGSGWLFSSYFAAKSAGPAAILSWLIAAVIVTIMALSLAEIGCIYPKTGLFSRLITLSHNEHFGFVTALSNWFVGIVAVPSEAIATIQYISTIYPKLTPYIFHGQQFTVLGVIFVAILLSLFCIVNYWGIRLLVLFNNAIVVVKIVIPTMTALIVITTHFNAHNFTAYHHSFMPYGIKSVFSTIVSSGIFYSFYGFQAAVSFASDLKDPKRSIPKVLMSSVWIVFLIYVLLQIAFIAAMPSHKIENGWHVLHFTSPLAQLCILLGLNFLATILYIDACISPTGTGIVYLGASTRMLTAMAQSKQIPQYFCRNLKNNMSRPSLLVTYLFCLSLILYFRNWQNIAIFTTTFILLACIALPISYYQISASNTNKDLYHFRLGKIGAPLVFLFLTVLFLAIPYDNLLIMVILHIVLFLIYAVVYSHAKNLKLINIIKSSWTIFLYLVFVLACTVFDRFIVPDRYHTWLIAISLVLSLGVYRLLLKQKSY